MTFYDKTGREMPVEQIKQVFGLREEEDLPQRTRRSEHRGRGGRQEGFLGKAARNDGLVGGLLGGEVGMVPRSLRCASRKKRRFGRDDNAVR